MIRISCLQSKLTSDGTDQIDQQIVRTLFNQSITQFRIEYIQSEDVLFETLVGYGRFVVAVVLENQLILSQRVYICSRWI